MTRYVKAKKSGAWLRERVRELIRQRGHANVTLSHVRAHARTPGNEAADQLAKEAARDEGVSTDAKRALELASTVHRRVHGEKPSDFRIGRRVDGGRGAG